MEASLIMSSLIAKVINGKKYYYLVDSARVDGKPRIVHQQYLGTAAAIAEAVEEKKVGDKENPTYGRTLGFGAEAALLDIAERLDARQIIDGHVGKRNQGLPVGTTIVLASINRAVGQVSKAEFFDEWFDATVLPRYFPAANKRNLSSQGFWNNMSQIDQTMITAIETDIVKKVVQNYNISSECLLFDNTNFFTYINTASQSKLAKRGCSKEHRSDLKIIGLSLMVSPDFNMPLFHETYAGNTNDCTRFSEIIASLKQRYLDIFPGENKITLIFDRGNNSSSNIEKILLDDPCSFDFVGGLKQCQYGNLLEIADGNYRPLIGDKLNGMSAFRTVRDEYNMPVTVVVTDNPKLYETQLIGVASNISKCQQNIDNLIIKFEQRNNGELKGGKTYTVEYLDKKINDILCKEHMKFIFDYDISQKGKKIYLKCSINDDKYTYLKRVILGKKVLFTNHMDWTNEKIVSAYHSQSHVEEYFEQMKNTKLLSFKPIGHFTDCHIRVHAFYCVLALILATILKIEIKELGYDLSLNKCLSLMSKFKQIINTYVKSKNKIVQTFTFEGLEGVAKKYFDRYQLDKYTFK
jgi:transposase